MRYLPDVESLVGSGTLVEMIEFTPTTVEIQSHIISIHLQLLSCLDNLQDRRWTLARHGKLDLDYS